MNTLKKILILFAATLVAAVSSGHSAVKIGQPAPDFSLTDLDGKVHQLSELKGKTVVIEWTNPDCPFVQKHYQSGNIPKLQKAAAQEGVVWLVVETGSNRAADKVKSWQRETGSAAVAYLRDADGQVGRSYAAKTTPHLYVVSPDGVVVYQGAIDSIRSADTKDITKAKNYVAAALDAVKAGKPVEDASTQPYGCAVKY